MLFVQSRYCISGFLNARCVRLKVTGVANMTIRRKRKKLKSLATYAEPDAEVDMARTHEQPTTGANTCNDSQ